MHSHENAGLHIPGLINMQPIGAGGSGQVFCAEQPAFNRTVAVKVLTDLSPRAMPRFDRECRALGALGDHPHIVTVFDTGYLSDGRPYLVMEYLPAGSISDRLQQNGPFSWEQASDITIRIAGALQTAHDRGIIHRDVKPGNILLSSYDEPVLADFGLATFDGQQRTSTGHITATVIHASPEVLAGHPPSQASDIYSLGSTFFSLLRGVSPFESPTDESIIPLVNRIANTPVPDLRLYNIPPEICAVMEKSMEKETKNRYEQSEDMGKSLQQAQKTLQSTITPMRVSGRLVSPAASQNSTNPVATPLPPSFVQSRSDSVPIAETTIDPRVTSSRSHPSPIAETTIDPEGTSLHEGYGTSGNPAPSDKKVTLIAQMAAESQWDTGNSLHREQGAEKKKQKPLKKATILLCASLFTLGLLAFFASVLLGNKNENDALSSMEENTEENGLLGVPASENAEPEETVLEQVTVPNLMNLDYKKALPLIEEAGLKWEADRRVSETSPEGRVIDQSPLPDTQVSANSTVLIVISTGKGKRVIPDLTKMSVEQAGTMLIDMGLGITTEETTTTDVPSDIVVKTIPSAGTEAEAGDVVTVIVAVPPTTTVTTTTTTTTITASQPIILHNWTGNSNRHGDVTTEIITLEPDGNILFSFVYVKGSCKSDTFWAHVEGSNITVKFKRKLRFCGTEKDIAQQAVVPLGKLGPGNYIIHASRSTEDVRFRDILFTVR